MTRQEVSQSRHTNPQTDNPLNVLLLSVPSSGHLSPVLALGEELVTMLLCVYPTTESSVKRSEIR